MFIHKFQFHSKMLYSFKNLFSFKNFLFIQYLFISYIQAWKNSHVIVCFQPTKIGERWRTCLIVYILKRGTSCNELEVPGTSWNKLEQAGTSWNYLKRIGTTWNKVKPPGASRLKEHKKQETRRKKLCVQQHCPIEYNIRNSCCHKKHHLRCLQVEPPGTEWNQ